MKKVFLSLLIVAFAFSIKAQEKGKIRVGFDLGLGLPTAGLGFGGDLDIRYNITDNINAGIKFTADILNKDVVPLTSTSFLYTDTNITSSLLTGDYYFNKGNSIFAPYLGGGLGFYKIYNNRTEFPEPTPQTSVLLVVTPDQRFGGLIRGGFESGHFRMGFEYFLIPTSKLTDIYNNNIGISENSFIKFSLGFYFGGGHWKK